MYAKNESELDTAVGVADSLRSLAANVKFTEGMVTQPVTGVNGENVDPLTQQQKQIDTVYKQAKAMVDRNDAQHIANNAGSEKISHISQIKKLIETAVLYANDTNAVHNKFDQFWHYRWMFALVEMCFRCS